MRQCARAWQVDVASATCRPGSRCRGANFENDIETCAPVTSGRSCARRRREVGQAHARAVLVGDFLHHRQAQAGALALGGDVGLEGALEHLVGEAGPVVDHRAGAPRAARPLRCAPPRCARRTWPSGRSATASSAFCTRLWITWRSCVASPMMGGRPRRQLGVQAPALLRLAVQRQHLARPARSGRAAAAARPAAARSRGTR